MAVMQIQLKDGPSKFDLMLALFDRKPKTRLVTFVATSGQEFTTSIAAMEAEDGSGESWNIRGFGQMQPAGLIGWRDACKIYFRTDTRKGTITTA